MLYGTVLFAGVCAAAFVIRRPKPVEPPTWAQTVLGAMFVWFMFALGYGVIPHEWMTFGNSYLNFDSSSFLLHKNSILPFDITRDKVVDAGRRGHLRDRARIEHRVLRRVAEAQGRGARRRGRGRRTVPGPITGGSIFSRLRREKRTSAYGRPVTSSES